MHWRNSHFQITNFIAGSCHTPDEAYRKLMELREERDVAIKNVKASLLREQAKIKKAEHIIASDAPEWDKLEAQADLEEINAFKEQSQACYEEAVRERDFIDSLIEQIKPHRKFAHLPDHEAHQAAQLEEWKDELKFRAENFLASQGTIPHDHLATMRMHPAWQTELLPHVRQISEMISKGNNTALPTKYAPVLVDMTDKQEGTEP